MVIDLSKGYFHGSIFLPIQHMNVISSLGHKSLHIQVQPYNLGNLPTLI
jgi:hypothetical protein